MIFSVGLSKVNHSKFVFNCLKFSERFVSQFLILIPLPAASFCCRVYFIASSRLCSVPANVAFQGFMPSPNFSS